MRDDDIDIVPVEIDRETRERLVRFSVTIGKHPAKVAAELLRDILLDDEESHPTLN